MNAPYLLIWFKDGDAHAAELCDLPHAFVYSGQTFHRVSGYFGDADYLRDADNRLVGFGYAFAVDKREMALYEGLLSQSTSVRRGDGMLMVLLASGPFEIECVQAMGSELYRSQAGAMMVVVPNSGFGNLAFKLAAAEVPWPENFEDRE
ncbi:MAG TPA: hypothetical protein VL527_19605 [Dongiaceae bacterium]|jgi:hypothetical protein|nr:hypothetical protein [Dongiaceae bacterium]